MVDHVDDPHLEVDSCLRACGSDMEGRGHHHPVQEKGPCPVRQLSRHYLPFGTGQMLYAYTHITPDMGY